jgi:hypothetical protein
MFVPYGIAWSPEGCMIRTRVRGPLSFTWDELCYFGPGNGAFVLKFRDAALVQIYTGAFERAEWKQFVNFLRTHHAKKARGFWDWRRLFRK